MTNIISMTSYLNAKRAAAASAARDAAIEEAKQKRLTEAAAAALALGAKIGKTPREQVIGALNAAALEAEQISNEEAVANSGPMPAYCDPENEYRGSKYDATKGLSLKEVAKRIRQDIKQMIAAGTLPKGLKVSVRMDGYNALRVNVMAVPESVRVYNPDYARATKNFTDYSNPDVYGYRAIARYTEEFNRILETLDANTNSYNRDNSDTMTDYFDVRFYDGRATLAWEAAKAVEARESVDLNS